MRLPGRGTERRPGLDPGGVHPLPQPRRRRRDDVAQLAVPMLVRFAAADVDVRRPVLLERHVPGVQRRRLGDAQQGAGDHADERRVADPAGILVRLGAFAHPVGVLPAQGAGLAASALRALAAEPLQPPRRQGSRGRLGDFVSVPGRLQGRAFDGGDGRHAALGCQAVVVEHADVVRKQAVGGGPSAEPRLVAPERADVRLAGVPGRQVLEQADRQVEVQVRQRSTRRRLGLRRSVGFRP